MLIDALVHSWNLATVHLGLRVGVDRVQGFLRSFGLGRDINPNPSLLLGAVDLSPYDVARLYQYLADDGHALPLRALRGVLDAKGRPLTRYWRKARRRRLRAGDAAGHLCDAAGRDQRHRARDRRIRPGNLHAAGKTGTSDTQRDSWFAGFTGAQLAVAWVGRDDNKPTGLMGATGALRIWIELMKRMPPAPLDVPKDGVELAFVDRRIRQAHRFGVQRRARAAVRAGLYAGGGAALPAG